jgi:hypothetical protein
VNQKLFTILLQPIEAIIASMSPIIDHESLSQKLFFADFVRKLLFVYIEQVSSPAKFAAGVENQRQVSGVRAF